MDWKAQIDENNLPRHVAVIMDGNGRWAKQKGQPRVFGHRNGVKAVRETTEAAAELGIEYLPCFYKRIEQEYLVFPNLTYRRLEIILGQVLISQIEFQLRYQQATPLS